MVQRRVTLRIPRLLWKTSVESIADRKGKVRVFERRYETRRDEMRIMCWFQTLSFQSSHTNHRVHYLMCACDCLCIRACVMLTTPTRIRISLVCAPKIKRVFLFNAVLYRDGTRKLSEKKTESERHKKATTTTLAAANQKHDNDSLLLWI